MSGNQRSKATIKASAKDLRQRGCRQPGVGHPCTCAMGNVSRFIEPVVLRILKEKKKSYGYEIAECLPRYALTDATIEGAALYRTLRTLESNGYVSSTWDDGDGPARRNYSLTRAGHTHLRDWAHLLEALGKKMMSFHHEVVARQDA
jgi:PadR family transcriptional regulator, regulatory protein PadR